MEKELEKMISDHWAYVAEVIIMHTHDAPAVAPSELLEIVEFHYKTAFEHGYKHAMQDMKQEASTKEPKINIQTIPIAEQKLGPKPFKADRDAAGIILPSNKTSYEEGHGHD